MLKYLGYYFAGATLHVLLQLLLLLTRYISGLSQVADDPQAAPPVISNFFLGLFDLIIPIYVVVLLEPLEAIGTVFVNILLGVFLLLLNEVASGSTSSGGGLRR